MNDLDDIKSLLSKMIETVDALATETANLVEDFYTNRTAPEFPSLVPRRAAVLREAALSMRQVAAKVLGKTDQSEEPHRGSL